MKSSFVRWQNVFFLFYCNQLLQQHTPTLETIRKKPLLHEIYLTFVNHHWIIVSLAFRDNQGPLNAKQTAYGRLMVTCHHLQLLMLNGTMLLFFGHNSYFTISCFSIVSESIYFFRLQYTKSGIWLFKLLAGQ